MKYQSTRGGARGSTFEHAIFSGYAADGGLYFPESIPTVSTETLHQWSKLSYVDLATEILSLFISESEIPKDTLHGLMTKAFSRISVPEVVKITQLDGELNVAELFHGPTYAFKDLALSCMGQFFEYFLNKRKKHMTILVGTSGDTGSAAIESIRGLKWVDIVVLLPKDRCSQVQELQMTTVIEDNVHIYRVEGTSDDLDLPIKRCFTDSEFAAQHNLCSINSINWGRILAQTVHYFYCYFQMCPSCDGEVEIVVPTGACGNVTGGIIAHQMGLPVRLVTAVNTNDIVARTISQGDFSMAPEVQTTFASAMDIQIPYNIERMLYIFSGLDSDLILKLMKQFEADYQMEVPTDVKNKMQTVLSTFQGDNDLIVKTMRRCWEASNYLLCPHTALAVAYHYSKNHSECKTVPRVCIATASPLKFGEVVTAASLTLENTEAINKLLTMPTQYQDMLKGQNWDEILRDKIRNITQMRAGLV